MHADYEFYRDTHHGNMSEADFLRHGKSASDFIDAVTFGRITAELMENEAAAYRIHSACCECADVLKSRSDRADGITQEKVGDLTVSYAGQKTARTVKAEMYGIAEGYLSGICSDGVMLMYRGAAR